MIQLVSVAIIFNQTHHSPKWIWSAVHVWKENILSIFVVSFIVVESKTIVLKLTAASIYVKFGLADWAFIWLLLFIWAICSWRKISVFIHHFWQPCILPLYLTLIYYPGQILEEHYYVDLYLEDMAFIRDWGNALFVNA